MIPRSFTTMSVNFYTTQQTINQSKILAFFFRVSVNKGAKKKGICLLLDDEKVQYYPQTSVVNKPSIYDHFPVGSRLFFYFIFLRPPSGAMDCSVASFARHFFLL